ncbi:hypothetical protein [Nocardia cyriacigeorgica]|uniref:hypothetical protein n=1 Tax=Nocardia cyriacigeorgica TaxID=135487 RepID=UPI0024561B75|nr:hypothetical protein [Nocardia cyriacigeorgica]
MTTTEPRTTTTTAVWAFELRRDRDTTGYSGTGTVADGVVFGDGTTVLHWRGWGGRATGTVVGVSLRHIYEPHTHGGDTRFVWTHGGPPLDPDYARRTDTLCAECHAPMIERRADDAMVQYERHCTDCGIREVWELTF